MCCMRKLAAWTAILLLVVSSGCRDDEGKDGKKETGSSASSAGRQSKTSAASAAKKTSPASGGAGIAVNYATPDDIAAIVIHPRRMAVSPLAAAELQAEPFASAMKGLGIGPSDIEEIVLLIGLDKNSQPAPAVSYIRFAHDVEAPAFLLKLQALIDPKEVKPLVEETIEGKTCYVFGRSSDPLAYAPDKNTIIFAFRDDMKSVLGGGESQGPLYDRLRAAGAGGDIIAVAEAEKYANLPKAIDGLKANAPPMVRDFLEAVKTAREATVTLDLSGDNLLEISLSAADVTSGVAAESLLKSGRKSLVDALAAARQNQSKEVQQKYAEALKMGAEAVDSINIVNRGAEITVTVKRPAGADKPGLWIEQVQQALGAAAPPQPMK